MAAYVLLDNNNVVQNSIVWDGVAQFDIPVGWQLHLLPANPPTYNPGDTYNPLTDTVTPGSQVAPNAVTVGNAVANALPQLSTIISQAQAFQAQGPYAVANLANLNDLLTKAQTMAAAVATLAQDLRYLARLASDRFDGTT